MPLSPKAKSIFIVVLSIMISCGTKKSPERIVLRLDKPYSGSLRLKPCVAGARTPASPAATGLVDIPDCPIGPAEIQLIEPGGQKFFPVEQVKVVRAGDGVPVEFAIVIQ
jgi:hypothetical protein